MKILKQERVAIDSGRGGNAYFEAISDKKPTVEEIKQIQISLGYNPLGYSGPYDIKMKQKFNLWRTSWACFNSCD